MCVINNYKMVVDGLCFNITRGIVIRNVTTMCLPVFASTYFNSFISDCDICIFFV